MVACMAQTREVRIVRKEGEATSHWVIQPGESNTIPGPISYAESDQGRHPGLYGALSYAILRHKGQAMRIEISCPYDSEPLILHVEESYRSPYTPGGC